MAISFINKVFTFLPKTLTSDDTQKEQEKKLGRLVRKILTVFIPYSYTLFYIIR